MDLIAEGMQSPPQPEPAALAAHNAKTAEAPEAPPTEAAQVRTCGKGYTFDPRWHKTKPDGTPKLTKDGKRLCGRPGWTRARIEKALAADRAATKATAKDRPATDRPATDRVSSPQVGRPPGATDHPEGAPGQGPGSLGVLSVVGLESLAELAEKPKAAPHPAVARIIQHFADQAPDVQMPWWLGYGLAMGVATAPVWCDKKARGKVVENLGEIAGSLSPDALAAMVGVEDAPNEAAAE